MLAAYRLHKRSDFVYGGARLTPSSKESDLSTRPIRPEGGANMPMLDAYIPHGALRPEAEEQLLAQLTDALIINEGADPTNPQVRSIAWLFVHRPEQVCVAGSPAAAPH